MGFAVRVRSAGQKYGPMCHQRDRADVTEFVTLVRLSSLGQHVDVLALAGYKRRKSTLTAGPIRHMWLRGSWQLSIHIRQNSRLVQFRLVLAITVFGKSHAKTWRMLQLNWQRMYKFHYWRYMPRNDKGWASNWTIDNNWATLWTPIGTPSQEVVIYVNMVRQENSSHCQQFALVWTGTLPLIKLWWWWIN